jgi:hypothetical protein
VPATRYERYGPSANDGSHMPLDTGVHWEWSNLLTILLMLTLLFMALMLIPLVMR